MPRGNGASTGYDAGIAMVLKVARTLIRYSPSFGLVVHRDSGASICLLCRRAFLVSSIAAHFMNHPNFATYINNFNKSAFNENGIIPDRMESQLLELGTKHFIELGFYTSPTQDPLPGMDVLKFEKRYMGNYCPVSKQTFTAYFSLNISTMNDHSLQSS
ncbi:unnamed protein product [Mucor fragilis]